MALVRVHGVVKDYEWGTGDTIPELLGYPPDGKPQAEYWMGTHPSGEARLDDGTRLSEFLEKRAPVWLGEGHIRRFGAKLPFLFKILAIAKPLSIQCHPTTEQARAGWKKEARLRLDDPDPSHWDYQDDNRKAEVLYALSPVTAMCSFRPFEGIRRDFERLMPDGYRKYLHPEHQGDAGLSELFSRLYTLDKESLKLCIGEYLANLAESDLPLQNGPFLEPKGIVLEAAKTYPVDPGLFCPFLLHVLHLAPGEAVFLRPDTLHAYTRGVGLELMSASDNVLRGGLTHKKVDVPELLSLLEIAGGEQKLCEEQVVADGRVRVVTPTEEFALYVLPAGLYHVDQPSVEIFFCTEGKAKISSGAEWQTIRKGECWVKSASTDRYQVKVEGTLFSATTGA